MRLIASMNTKDELGRYLGPVIARLQSFCDEIRIQDDHSEDGTFEWLQEQDRVVVERNRGYTWREHEGYLHQNLLDFTMQGKPTHILAIDADEIVMYGHALRDMLEEDDHHKSFSLVMTEVWRTDPWLVRTDGGWRPHPVAILYKPGDMSLPEWKIWGRKMAGGRVPRMIRNEQRSGRCRNLPVDILHLGWANPAERQQRYDRYVELDDGKFHNKDHLDSIMLPDEAVSLEPYPEKHRNQLPELVRENPYLPEEFKRAFDKGSAPIATVEDFIA